MGEDRKYRLIGSVQAGSRIDRVEVEGPSKEFPNGKVLELHKPEEGRIAEGVPLNADQVTKLSGHVVLELVEEDVAGEEVELVDQPDINKPSSSTEQPPNTGTTPDVDAMDSEAVNAEIKRIREADANALGDVKLNDKLEDRKSALREHYATKGV